MSPDDKIVPTSMEPVTAFVVGAPSTGTGPGGLAGTGGGGAKDQLIQTPAGQPNVLVKYLSTVQVLVARALDTFLTTLLTLVAAGSTTQIIPASDFAHLLGKCASLAVAATVLGIIKDLSTSLGNFNKSHPLISA